jgi:hypothetical protein
MDFKEASSRLTDGYSLGDLARATGMSEATIRRARLDPTSLAYRAPPANWKAAVVQLAEERIKALGELVADLQE